MKEIPFFPYSSVFLDNTERYNLILKKVLSNGSFIMQEELLHFESNLSKFLNCKHVIGVADGTIGLTLALKASGIKSGDEVIVSSHTFIATAASIKHVGGIPVVCDCLPDSMMDVNSIEPLINKRTKAIMPTQLNGRICDMNALEKISKKYGLLIIEDSCQALGAKFENKNAGLFGEIGTFSFYPAKTLGCFGDGGALVTNSDFLAQKLRQLRDHGRNEEGKVTVWGHNARLDNIQAAILNEKLQNYQASINKRRKLASLYFQNLKDISDLILPPSPDEATKHYDIFQNYEIQSSRRDELKQFLKNRNIGTIIQWSGWMLHQFDDLGLRGSAPYAEEMSKRMLLLPMNQYLSVDEIKYICSTIKEFYSQ